MLLNFFKYSKVLAGFSIVLILLSLGLIFKNGFNFGIDFTGGVLIEISNQDKIIQIDDIEKLKKQFESNSQKVIIQTFVSQPNNILLKIASDKQLSHENFSENSFAKQIDALKQIITANFIGQNIIFEKIEFIGAKTGKDFFQKACFAVVLALLGIMIYLYFRFDWKFTIAGIVALMHDMIISFGFASLFKIEFNLIFITAILTIIGYSINDSVIIFDRIRELLKLKSNVGKFSMQELINQSLNNTLSRTIFTSLTTLLACMSLIIFGGKDLYSFSLVAFFGILIGTYSSIIIACQLIIGLDSISKK